MGNYMEFCDPDNGNHYVTRFSDDHTSMAIFDREGTLLHTEGLMPLDDFRLLERTATMTDYAAVYGAPHFQIGNGRDIPAYLCRDDSLVFPMGIDEQNALHFRKFSLKDESITDLLS